MAYHQRRNEAGMWRNGGGISWRMHVYRINSIANCGVVSKAARWRIAAILNDNQYRGASWPISCSVSA